MTAEFQETSREPLKPVIDTPAALEECLSALTSGTGPVAFDAERAHGHRYWPKAYLFQIRREGAGTWLLDPLPFEDSPDVLAKLAEQTREATWLIHAASQDLPCMRDAGIYPERIFDTELAARLLGEPAAGLRALLEAKLGVRLRKAHSADNWATRPLPESWLTYAALDVDYLIDLYEVLERDLADSGRLTWAEQEFDDILERFREVPEPPEEPWRRLSNITSLRKPRQLAVARALWQERDRLAQDRDRPPGRLLADAAIIGAASQVPAEGDLSAVRLLDSEGGFRSRNAKRFRTNWVRAIESVNRLTPKQFPSRHPRTRGIGHPRTWERRNPAAAVAWTNVKPAIDELACDLGFQASLVAPPAAVQSVVYHHHGDDDFADSLAEAGVRPWQIEFLDPLLREHLASGPRGSTS